MKPVLLIHGGAGGKALTSQRRTLFTESLNEVLQNAYPVLERGGSAIKAVVRAVSLLENDPIYNAGKGSKIQSDGHIRMSASIMDGKSRRFAGCVNVEDVKNPIRLSEALLKKQDRVLATEGALRFAREAGLEMASPFTDKQLKNFVAKKSGKSGTVGAVALDKNGNLAAATSTGGRGYEYAFRVSDSPTTAGNFANLLAAVSAMGIGEHIVEYSVASTICAYMEAGMSLQAAVKRLFANAKRNRVEFGIIALNFKGEFFAHTTTKGLIWAVATSDGVQFMRK